jgi:hypothetical protein
LIKAASIEDIELCKASIARGANDYEGMIICFWRSKSAIGAAFSLDCLETVLTEPCNLAFRRRLISNLLSLFASIGDDTLFLKTSALYIEALKASPPSEKGEAEKMWPEMGSSMRAAVECAAENGHIGLCDRLLSEVYLHAMLRGGVRGSSLAICKKAMELGAKLSVDDLLSSAKSGSVEVFKLALSVTISSERRRQLSLGEKECIMRMASIGKDGPSKLDFLLSQGWTVENPESLLQVMSHRGSVCLYNWMKLNGENDGRLHLALKSHIESGTCFKVYPKCLTSEYLEALLADGADLSKLHFFGVGNVCEVLNREPSSPEKASERMKRVKERKESINELTRYLHILHEHGYRRYGAFLAVAIHARSEDLIDMVLRWGRDDLKEDDTDYAKFVWIASLIPEHRKNCKRVFRIQKVVLDSVKDILNLGSMTSLNYYTPFY